MVISIEMLIFAVRKFPNVMGLLCCRCDGAEIYARQVNDLKHSELVCELYGISDILII